MVIRTQTENVVSGVRSIMRFAERTYVCCFGICPSGELDLNTAKLAFIVMLVFDRIREYLAIKPGERLDVVNQALNSTLSRTINTSLTTFFVFSNSAT